MLSQNCHKNISPWKGIMQQGITLQAYTLFSSFKFLLFFKYSHYHSISLYLVFHLIFF